MTNYQKLATMIFRIIGFFLIAYGFISSFEMMIIPWFIPEDKFKTAMFNQVWYLMYLPNLIYMTIGFLLFASSRSLAKWICFDFDKFNE